MFEVQGRTDVERMQELRVSLGGDVSPEQLLVAFRACMGEAATHDEYLDWQALAQQVGATAIQGVNQGGFYSGNSS